jgi:hypothetical protein
VPPTVTAPSAAIVPVAPAALLNSLGTIAASCGCDAGGAGGGGGGSNFAAGVGRSRPPACVPTKIDLPSGVKLTLQTLDFIGSGPSCSPLATTSQSFTAPSRLPVVSRDPSGENAADVTQSLWPVRLANSLASDVVQSFTVRSAPAVANFDPSGE